MRRRTRRASESRRVIHAAQSAAQHATTEAMAGGASLLLGLPWQQLHDAGASCTAGARRPAGCTTTQDDLQAVRLAHAISTHRVPARMIGM